MPDILSPSTSIFGELNFTLGSGTITAGNRQIVPTSSGLSLNVPDTKGIYGSINDVNFLALTPSSFWLGDLATGATVSYIYGTGSGLTLNTATGNTFSFTINGSNNAVFSSSLATLSATNGIYFPSTTGSVTGANRSIVPTAAGLQLNVPTGKYIVGSVNGTEVFHAEVATSSGYFQLGSSGSGSRFYADSGGSFISTPSGSTQDSIINSVNVLSLSSALATLGTTDGIYLTSSTGTITGSRRQISGTSTGLDYNAPTGTAHVFSVNGTAAGTLSVALLTLAATNGIYFSSTSGVVTAGQNQIAGNTGGMGYNVATASSHYFSVNGTNYVKLGANGVDFTGLSPGKITGTGVSMDGFGNLALCSATGQGTAIIVNGNIEGFLGTFGWITGWTTQSGISNAGYYQISPSSTGMDYNVPTGKKHIFKINNVEILRIEAGGLVVSNDPQDWFIYSQNYYH